MRIVYIIINLNPKKKKQKEQKELLIKLTADSFSKNLIIDLFENYLHHLLTKTKLMKKKLSLFLAAFIALVTYTVRAAIQASEPEVIFSAVATTANQYSNGENEITSDYATFTGGKIYAVSAQDTPKDLIKTWSNAVYFCQTNNNTYFKVVLDKPLAVGDIITCDALAGVKKDSKTGEITGWISQGSSSLQRN